MRLRLSGLNKNATKVISHLDQCIQLLCQLKFVFFYHWAPWISLLSGFHWFSLLKNNRIFSLTFSILTNVLGKIPWYMPVFSSILYFMTLGIICPSCLQPLFLCCLVILSFNLSFSFYVYYSLRRMANSHLSLCLFICLPIHPISYFYPMELSVFLYFIVIFQHCLYSYRLLSWGHLV